MAVTEELPVAVLTSFDNAHPELRQLPQNVAVNSLETNFEEDLTGVFANFSLA